MENINRLKSIVASASKRTRKRKWSCFFPGCSKLVIDSHSQTKSTSLACIQENGHVIQRSFDPLHGETFPEWKSVGIGKASIFKGFCKDHDGQLFKQADSISEKNLAKEALLSLAYRTFAMEMRKKEFHADLTGRILSQINVQQDELWMVGYDGFRAGLMNCIKVTKPYYVDQFGYLETSSNYPSLTHKVYKFNQNLNISCSTLINPVSIFSHPVDTPQPIVLFNVLPRKRYSLAVFSCFQDDLVLLDEFLKQFYRLEDLVFNFCEEIIFNITFFKSLTNELLELINMSQGPWTTWQPTQIPDIFKVYINKDSLFHTL